MQPGFWPAWGGNIAYEKTSRRTLPVIFQSSFVFCPKSTKYDLSESPWCFARSETFVSMQLTCHPAANNPGVFQGSLCLAGVKSQTFIKAIGCSCNCQQICRQVAESLSSWFLHISLRPQGCHFIKILNHMHVKLQRRTLFICHIPSDKLLPQHISWQKKNKGDDNRECFPNETLKSWESFEKRESYKDCHVSIDLNIWPLTKHSCCFPLHCLANREIIDFNESHITA